MLPLLSTSAAPIKQVLLKQTTTPGNMSAKTLLLAALSTVALAAPFDGHVEERQSCAAQWYELRK